MPKTPTRFPNGVTTAAKSNALGKFGLPDPTKWHTYFDDFDYFTSASWTITEIGAGGTTALTDAAGGVLLITSDALDNDGVQIQKDGEGFLPTSGKQLFFKARFTTAKITQSDWLIGLAVLDTTLLDAVGGDGVTDGMFFSKEDGDTNIDFHCQKNTTTGQIDATAIAVQPTAGTYVELAFYFDGIRYIQLFVDGVHKSTVDLTSTLSTYLPDTELTPSVAYLNGEAGATTLSLDYLFVAQER
jgi:hypothetical protein